MSQNVIVTVSTVGKDFPAGTADVAFTYTLNDKTGAVVATIGDVGTTVTFPNVVDGDYSVSAEKFGVTATQSFTVSTGNVSLQVPQTVAVTFS